MSKEPDRIFAQPIAQVPDFAFNDDVVRVFLWRALARLGSSVPQRSALLAAGGALAFVFITASTFRNRNI